MQKIIWRLGLVLLIMLALVGAFFVGAMTGAKEQSLTTEVADIDLSPFWQAWRIIDDKFVATTTGATTTNQKRVWGAIGGMVDALGDPYTIFLPPAEKKNFEQMINGNFGGVGIEIDLRHKILTVVSALAGTPAKAAGLQPNDQIIKIDDKSTLNLGLDDAVGLIRGEIGTIVKLTVAREGENKTLEFNLKRSNIVIPTLETEKKDDVFVIKLFNFGANSPNAFRQALREFIEAKTDKMIIDLRGNPGGLLEAAVDMASWFLPLGEPVVIERGRDSKNEKIHRSYGYNVFTDKLKLAILVDDGSASAAEILAGALSEYGRAALVGEKTFGKGSVQELVDVLGGSSLKITVAKWYTPKGVSLSDNGLTPTVIVERGKKDTEDKDQQLLKAIEILKQ